MDTKESLFKEKIRDKYNSYKDSHDSVTDSNLGDMDTLTLLGYILTVYSASPISAINRLRNENLITYEKGKELELLVNILE